MTIIELVVGNTAPNYDITLQDNDDAVDLTSATSAKISIKNAHTDEYTVQDYSLSIQSPLTGGVVRYTPVAAHFDVEGRYLGNVKVRYSDGSERTFFSQVEFVVREP